MRLSKNLTLAEVTKSQTAVRKGIDNTPHGEHLDNLFHIAQNIFQPIRDYFGVPIAVTSGYRSQALNEAIGGSKTSQHSRGEALDLDADVFGGVIGKTENFEDHILQNAEIFHYIRQRLVFDQLIWEFGNKNQPAWVHVSLKRNGNNRNEVLVAYKDGGRTRYKHYE